MIVICALSGGVDSAVAALFLKKKYSIQGVFLKTNDDIDKKAELKVKIIAEKLNIPLKIVDLRKEFQQKVVQPFLKEYQKNRTPNPCVFCNKNFKFYFLFEQLIKFDANFISTGHYARIKKKKNSYHLLRAKSSRKDQSYFLYRLTQKDLKKIIFPLGDLDKKEILEIAKQNNLIDDKYQESQEICFIKDNIRDYLQKKIGQNQGKIVNIDGKILGEHQGLHFYTIGQRRGIGFSDGPFYIVKKDRKDNVLIISKNKKDLDKKYFKITEVSWINKVDFPLNVRVKVRSNSKLKVATIIKKEKDYFIELQEEEKGITPGQSAVFYKGDEILGGGIIKN